MIDNKMKDYDILLNEVLGKIKHKELKNISILFTGATGFLGIWVLRCLNFISKKNNCKILITILTRNKKNIYLHKREFQFLRLKFIIDDVSKVKIKKEKFDIIFHFAASSSKKENFNKHGVVDTIINGTLNIIKIAENLKVKNIIFLSSGAVYGKHCNKNTGWKEDDNQSPDILDPNATYGLAKKCAENLLINWGKRYKTNLLIIRSFSFGVISEKSESHFAFDNFIKKRIENKNIIMNSTGNSKRNFMHPIDLCNWIFRSLPLSGINVINSGSKECISIKNLAKKIANFRITGLEPVKVHKGKDTIKENYFPNLEKSHNLGYSEKINLNEQIKNSINLALRHNKKYGKSNSV